MSKLSVHSNLALSGRPPTGLTTIAVACIVVAANAHAFEIDTGVQDFTARWDNTIKYSAADRLRDRSAQLATCATCLNQNDGDQAFDKGIISNRLDLLSELDLAYQGFGARLSGATWYDKKYTGSDDNDSPATFNARSVSSNQFTAPTRRLHGNGGEILDAFVYAQGSAGPIENGIVRVGKHSVLYGESLFFGNNGIAGGQAPVDIVKLLSVPGSTFKETIRPVGQISTQLQLQTNLSVGAYYQYEWQKSRLPGVGSYFSGSDVIDQGGERLRAGPVNAFFRGSDLDGKDSGQFGAQLRYTVESIETDFGLYAIRYHDKTPRLYTMLGKGADPSIHKIGEYILAYGRDITAYGASASTNVGTANVGMEVSVRHNAPLVCSGQAVTPAADNDKNPGYAVGNTAHAQVSVIYPLPRNALWEGGAVSGEIAWNRRTSVTKNPKALDPLDTRDASAMRFKFAPSYKQVMPGLDISVPFGVGYGLSGRSSAVSNFSVYHGGDVSLGVDGEYQQVWRISVNYTQFIGAEKPTLDPTNKFTFAQSLRDRDFVSVSIQRTF